jgi:gliding motility-associated lipoprotein GldD
VYANVIKDSTYFDTKPENDYWVNLDFPRNNARIFISYKVIGGEAYYKTKQPDGTYKDSTGVNRFELLVRDAYKLTNKNDVQATSIADNPILTSNGISGIYFRVGGNAATSRQFFLSDSVRHFIRGSLYFDCTPNADSLQPAIDFYEKDIMHLINTFKWKNQSTP